jgi:hypothetical protein
LLIIAELAEENPNSLSEDVKAAFARTGGNEVYDLLADRISHLAADVQVERLALITMFILRAVAERARLMGRRRKGRPQLEHEAFVNNLIAMAAAAMAAPA